MSGASRTPARVAVVIPCYAQAHFLDDAIASVTAQEHAAHEIIVVDDGSPDATSDVALGWAARDSRIRLVRQANRGLAGARNAGLREVASDFVAFLDADDRLLPGALAAGLAALERRPDAALAYGALRLVDREGRPLATGQPTTRCADDRDYAAMLRNNFIGAASNVLFRTGVLRAAGGFDERYRSAEDYELYLRLAWTHPIACHENVVADYRQHGESLTRRYAGMLHWTLLALAEQESRVTGDPALEAARRAGVRRWEDLYGIAEARRLLVGALRHGRVGDALRGAGMLMRFGPRGVARAVRRRLGGA